MFLPIAVEYIALAIVLSPIAVEDCALATVSYPIAEELTPELVVKDVLICAFILNEIVNAKSVSVFFILNYFTIKLQNCPYILFVVIYCNLQT